MTMSTVILRRICSRLTANVVILLKTVCGFMTFTFMPLPVFNFSVKRLLRSSYKMNRDEKKGCESILKKIDHLDLMSLKDTVTKRQIVAENKNDAIRAIITYSESSAELLKRKKIRREVIFQYLADNDVRVSASAEKHQLINKTLQFWGVKVSSAAQAEASAGGDVNHNTSECQTETPDCRSNGTQSPTEPVTRHCMSTQAVVTPPDTQLQVRQQCGDVQLSGQHHPHPGITSAVASTSTDVRLCANLEQQKLGETFVSWFYKILNSHNPALNQTPEDFGPHHFWNDVKLHLLTVTTEQTSDRFDGAVLVSQRLLALVREEQLLFNPNLSADGIQVKSDPHGLLVVMVCGTIHRGNDCLGIFQQMFGLIGDPRYDNNWKVKITKLRIQSTQVTAIPKLQDSDNSDMMSLVPSSTDLTT